MFWELQMNMCDDGNTKASYVCLQLDDNYQVAITGYRLRQDKQSAAVTVTDQLSRSAAGPPDKGMGRVDYRRPHGIFHLHFP